MDGEGGISVDRLTEHNKNSLAMADCCGKACENNYVCEVGGFGECRGMDDIIDRLSDIEDILGDDYDLDRLREMVEADRDGRCVVLPCKLYDKVFFIENGCVKETEVDSFHNWTSGRWKLSTHTDRMFDHWKGYEIDFDGIGKTVFLTREAAEAALKGDFNEN